MKVSVAMITYNHEAFVAQAIDSVLMQDSEFNFELVVGEDCSTDSTRSIVSEYARNHPDKIRLLETKKNLGMVKNLERTLLACRGEYIALLEGDDYWTSATKLQKQVQFLDANPNCTICFHNALAFYEDGSRQPWQYCGSGQKPTSTLQDILKANFIPTCSVMFRGIPFKKFPAWLSELSIADWPLHVFYAEHGNIGYLDESMSAYRFHPSSVYSMQSPIFQQKQILRMYEQLNKHLRLKFESLINERIFDCCYALAVAYARTGALNESQTYANLCLRARPLRKNLSRRMKVILHTLAPEIIQFLSSRRGR